MQTIKCVVVGDGAVGMKRKILISFIVLFDYNRKNMSIN
jgi:hypothetical protein